MNPFNRRLKSRREELSISIRKICSDLSISKSTYEGWEIDSYPRNPQLYKSLADYLKVSTEYLMFGSENAKVSHELLYLLEKLVRSIMAEQFKSTDRNRNVI